MKSLETNSEKSKNFNFGHHLHAKVNTADLNSDQLLLSKEIIEEIVLYHQKNPHKVKLNKKDKEFASKFQGKNARSVLFIKNKYRDVYNMYALYRDFKKTKPEGYLGEGTFGRVKLAQNLNTGQWVAIKIIKDNLKTGRSAINEINILEELGLLLDNVAIQYHKFYVVQPLAPGIKLENFYKSEAFEKLYLQNSKEALKTMFGLSLTTLKSLQSVHEKGINHNDLKPFNILVDINSKTGTIIDFGLARKVNRDPDQYSFMGFENKLCLDFLVEHGVLIDLFQRPQHYWESNIQMNLLWNELMKDPVLLDVLILIHLMKKEKDNVETLHPYIKLLEYSYYKAFKENPPGTEAVEEKIAQEILNKNQKEIIEMRNFIIAQRNQTVFKFSQGILENYQKVLRLKGHAQYQA